MLVAALMLAQAEPAVEPTASGEVTVTAARLRRLKLAVRKDRKTGENGCKFERRSGDPLLDATICHATLVCVEALPERVGRRAAVAQVRACMQPTMDRVLRPGEPWRASGS